MIKKLLCVLLILPAIAYTSGRTTTIQIEQIDNRRGTVQSGGQTYQFAEGAQRSESNRLGIRDLEPGKRILIQVDERASRRERVIVNWEIVELL